MTATTVKLTITQGRKEYEIPDLEQPAFGHWLCAQRKKMSCTQQDIADVCSVTRQAVFSWEKRETAPSLENAIKLAKFFSVDRNTAEKNKKLDDIADRMNRR